MHDCPDCGSACYCGGDVDDINLPLDPPGGCFHCDPFDDEHAEDDTDLAPLTSPLPLLRDDRKLLRDWRGADQPRAPVAPDPRDAALRGLVEAAKELIGHAEHGECTGACVFVDRAKSAVRAAESAMGGER